MDEDSDNHLGIRYVPTPLPVEIPRRLLLQANQLAPAPATVLAMIPNMTLVPVPVHPEESINEDDDFQEYLDAHHLASTNPTPASGSSTPPTSVITAVTKRPRDDNSN
jgi:hypothetical protein